MQPSNPNLIHSNTQPLPSQPPREAAATQLLAATGDRDRESRARAKRVSSAGERRISDSDARRPHLHLSVDYRRRLIADST